MKKKTKITPEMLEMIGMKWFDDKDRANGMLGKYKHLVYLEKNGTMSIANRDGIKSMAELISAIYELGVECGQEKLADSVLIHMEEVTGERIYGNG